MPAETAQRRLSAVAFETHFYNPTPRFMSLTLARGMQQAPRSGSSAVTAAAPASPAGTGEPRGPTRAAGPGRSVAAADERPRAVWARPLPRDYSSQQAVREAAPAAEAPVGAGPGVWGLWGHGGPRVRVLGASGAAARYLPRAARRAAGRP